MQIIAEHKDKNKRLDKFLVQLGKTEKKFSDFSRGNFIREIKTGAVLVNKSEIKPSYRLRENDKVEINIKEKESLLTPNPDINFEIICENENIIVVDKPAGLQVHPDYNEKLKTLVNGIIAKYPEISEVTEDNSALSKNRPGIVHRLDKDTSGLVVVARNKKTFDELKRIFQEREIEKKYLAIVYGVLAEENGIINKPLARTSNYRRQTIASKKTKTKIREAVTRYELIKKLKNNLSLLEVSPKTGRTHQIRVHLFSIGHPIIGDKLYKLKRKKDSVKSLRLHGASRHMLHASKIKFKLFGKEYELSAEPPSDFKSFLK